jgi:hypothetical protein
MVRTRSKLRQKQPVEYSAEALLSLSVVTTRKKGDIKESKQRDQANQQPETRSSPSNDEQSAHDYSTSKIVSTQGVATQEATNEDRILAEKESHDRNVIITKTAEELREETDAKEKKEEARRLEEKKAVKQRAEEVHIFAAEKAATEMAEKARDRVLPAAKTAKTTSAWNAASKEFVQVEISPGRNLVFAFRNV